MQMRNYIKKMMALIKNMRSQSIPMRRRLMIYLLLMGLTIFGVLAIGLVATGVIANSELRVKENLSLQLMSETRRVEEEFDNLTAQGIALSRNLGRTTQQFLTGRQLSLAGLNDRPDLLLSLQDSYYGDLNTSIQVSNTSGVYAVLDATTNTSLPESETSRSSLYLRVSNIDLTEKVNQEINQYRGIPEVGRQRGHALNNRWDLELDTNLLDGYQEMVSGNVSDILNQYRWDTRIKLPGMWEEVMLLMVPYTGTDGTVYGICGLEISEALFSLQHPAADSEFGNLVTVLAPVGEDGMHLEQGLVGGTEGTYLAADQVLTMSEKNGLVRFSSGYENYVGVCEPFSYLNDLSKNSTGVSSGDEEGDVTWKICILLPESSYQSFARRNRIGWLIAIALFVTVMVSASIFISKTYLKPILESVSALKGNEPGNLGKTGYSEIDELLAFLQEKNADQPLVEEKLPPNISELFDRFAENVGKLSMAERVVMDLYIEGHEISEIPELAFISMATVRKHNRNIYEKLEVSSRDEIMLYIDLFRRCDRLDELKQV